MIADLKPYPEYKESGLPWLGQVPRHWDTRPAFGAFVPNHERNCGMKGRPYSPLATGAPSSSPPRNSTGSFLSHSRHIKSSIPAT